jgi:hypothetical protein
MSLSKMQVLSVAGIALALCWAALPALAEQSGSQPQPSPTPKSPLEQARDDVDMWAKEAARAYADYLKTLCSETAGPTAVGEDQKILEKANALLDKAIEHEAELNPDVKDAAREHADAAAAEENAAANQNTSASDLFGLHKKTDEAEKKLNKTKKKHTDEIRKRLKDAHFVFGVPVDQCQKQDVNPKSPPPNRPNPKRKAGVSEDSPLYMYGYKAPANSKPSTTKKKSGDSGTGPSQNDVDRQTDQPSNDNDKQPEIPVPQ